MPRLVHSAQVAAALVAVADSVVEVEVSIVRSYTALDARHSDSNASFHILDHSNNT